MTYEKAHRAAVLRLAVARERMDELRAAFEKAEDEHHQACKALDELEDQPFIENVPYR